MRTRQNKIPAFTPVSFEYGLGSEESRKKVNIFIDFHERTSRHVKSGEMEKIHNMINLHNMVQNQFQLFTHYKFSEILTALEPVL